MSGMNMAAMANAMGYGPMPGGMGGYGGQMGSAVFFSRREINDQRECFPEGKS